MRKSLQVALIAAALGASSAGAVNFYDGAGIGGYLSQANWDNVKRIIARTEERYASNPDLENSVKLAQVLAYTGEHEKAIELLHELEKRYPDDAAVEAAMGAAYELSGNDSEALQWIRKFAAHEPQAHERSTWLHIRILEAKIALARDPNWLQNHTVLGVNFGTGSQPQMPVDPFEDENGDELSVMEVRVALSQQINFRKDLFPTPKPLLADLYAAAADIALAGGAPSGNPLWEYDCALGLEAAHADLVKQRRDMLAAKYPEMKGAPEQWVCRPDTRPYYWRAMAPSGLIPGGLAVAVCFLLIWARRRYG